MILPRPNLNDFCIFIGKSMHFHHGKKRVSINIFRENSTSNKRKNIKSVNYANFKCIMETFCVTEKFAYMHFT